MLLTATETYIRTEGTGLSVPTSLIKLRESATETILVAPATKREK